jgi:hypothetical protein
MPSTLTRFICLTLQSPAVAKCTGQFGRTTDAIRISFAVRFFDILFLLLLEWLYSPCGPSPLFQFPDLFYSQSAGLLE